jgi:uncharacterized membrane protein YbhN (UPF0104 family)
VSRALALGRIALSAVALSLVAAWLDEGAVLSRLGELRPTWVLLGLVISVAQVGVLAWRWRLTASRLGLDLPLRESVAEYYLGIMINQVLPGGVMGDVARAWRHARVTALTGPAVRAVILERASGQVVMVLVAAVSVLMLPAFGAVGRAGIVLGTLAVGVGAIVAFSRGTGADTVVGRLWSDARRACLARDVWALQLASALAVVGSYVAVFMVAARAVGVEAPLGAILPLVAPVLMTMLIPVTVAGWGLREGAAAALWGVAGLSPEEGAAASVAYGLLVLVSSAPGLVVLMRMLVAGRGRRARPHPE